MSFRIVKCSLACIVLAGSMFGCAIGGLVASKLGPGPTEDAKYVPPKEPMLVLVENYQHPALGDAAAERLGRQIAEELTQNKVAPIVPPASLVDLRDTKGEAYRQMKIPAIGEALGAKQVLYVNVISYDADSTLASDMVKGRVELRVRVVDVKTAKTVWPSEASTGYQVAVETDHTHLPDRAAAADMAGTICKTTADRVAKLFYKHNVEEDPEMSEPQ